MLPVHPPHNGRQSETHACKDTLGLFNKLAQSYNDRCTVIIVLVMRLNIKVALFRSIIFLTLYAVATALMRNM